MIARGADGDCAAAAADDGSGTGRGGGGGDISRDDRAVLMILVMPRW